MFIVIALIVIIAYSLAILTLIGYHTVQKLRMGFVSYHYNLFRTIELSSWAYFILWTIFAFPFLDAMSFQIVSHFEYNGIVSPFGTVEGWYGNLYCIAVLFGGMIGGIVLRVNVITSLFRRSARFSALPFGVILYK
jgi:hypothetical protein